MPTENMVYYFRDIGADTGVAIDHFGKSVEMAGEVFPL
jgi:hypothetical protein